MQTQRKNTKYFVVTRYNNFMSATNIADAANHDELKSTMDVNLLDQYKQTTLMIACQNNWMRAVQTLIESGADLDAKNQSNCSALMYAAGFGHVEATELLINAGAALETMSKGELTALMSAAAGGHVECVTLLLKKRCPSLHQQTAGSTIWNGFSHTACSKCWFRRVSKTVARRRCQAE